MTATDLQPEQLCNSMFYTPRDVVESWRDCYPREVPSASRFPPRSPSSNGGPVIAHDPNGRDLIGFALEGPTQGWMLRGLASVIDAGLVINELTVAPWRRPSRTRPGGLEDLMKQLDDRQLEEATRLPSQRVDGTLLRNIRVPVVERSLMSALRSLDRRERNNAKVIALIERSSGPSVFLPPPEQRRRASKVLRAAKRAGTKRGRTGYTDNFYRAIANECVRLASLDKRQGSVYEQLAEYARRNGLVHYEPNWTTARTWIRECRKRGLLLQARRGPFSPEPGPRYSEEGK